ncbi:FadR/GntR family transcriptional regulator [Kribbella sindirgiensis]|uniref:FadR/GntR family transcriptional regulator n=1 Tax=Kribbella sindirgiensis TaxID=1124744 RepID=UPI00192D5EA7|nr:FadR/GntR family transcriptional regulator [Kribbella sindirgiensis]
MAVTRSKRSKRSDELANAIADLIIERNLEPGAPLPPESVLMTDFSVSRNSVRESLKALQALGIVEIRHGYGTFVGSASSAALQPWLLFRTRSGSSTERLRELLEIREILETELTRRAARTGDGELQQKLSACVARMRDDGPDAATADREFHEHICDAAGVPLARELVGLFWDVYRAVETELETFAASPAETAARHQRVVDAIDSGDADLAEEAVHLHFAEVRTRLGTGPYRSLPGADVP